MNSWIKTGTGSNLHRMSDSNGYELRMRNVHGSPYQVSSMLCQITKILQRKRTVRNDYYSLHIMRPQYIHYSPSSQSHSPCISEPAWGGVGLGDSVTFFFFDLLLPAALMPSICPSASLAPFTSHSLIMLTTSKSRPNTYVRPRSPYILHKRSDRPMRVGSEDYIHSTSFGLTVSQK